MSLSYMAHIWGCILTFDSNHGCIFRSRSHEWTFTPTLKITCSDDSILGRLWKTIFWNDCWFNFVKTFYEMRVTQHDDGFLHTSHYCSKRQIELTCRDNQPFFQCKDSQTIVSATTMFDVWQKNSLGSTDTFKKFIYSRWEKSHLQHLNGWACIYFNATNFSWSERKANSIP